jgi:hypothetical protein
MEIEPVTRWFVVRRPAKECKIVDGSPSMTLNYVEGMQVRGYTIEHDKGDAEYNHAELGHAEGDRPVPQNALQKWWNDKEWIKVHTYSVHGRLL